MSEFGDALARVIAAGDPWRRRVDHCPGCKGEGRIYWAKALGGGHWADCDECDGTGNGDKDTPDE